MRSRVEQRGGRGLRRFLLDSISTLSRRFRRRRTADFLRILGINEETRVLDVGGTTDIWKLADILPRLVILNKPYACPETGLANEMVLGDACRLPFRDKSFDVVFSNSVIEHLGDQASEVRFAAEVTRVGKSYWIQTPNRYFPVDPHLWTPFVHWLPRRWRSSLVEQFTVWEWATAPNPEMRRFYLDHCLNAVRLMDQRELLKLFPGASVRKERLCGWTKSLVVFTAEPR
jgi:SAM-dependent methyltransferase